MTIEPIATIAVAATSAATVALAVAGAGMDAATITVVGAVACTIITALSIAIVKVLAALQDLKVAMISAAAERGKVLEKTVEHTEKLTAIDVKSNGNLSEMGKRLDEALRRMDEMQKAAALKISQLPSGSPDKPIEVKSVNTPEDPANVNQISKP